MKMNFKDFLTENEIKKENEDLYKKEISEEEVINHLKNIKYDIGNPFYRGVSKSYDKDCYIIDPSKRTRKSISTTNHYTVLIDHFSEKTKYQKRSKSIIFTTKDGKAHAGTFGPKLMVVIPMSDSSIYTDSQVHDLWNIKFRDIRSSLVRLNALFSLSKIKSDSYDSIIKQITEIKLDNMSDDEEILVNKLFGGNIEKNHVKKIINKYYNPKNLKFINHEFKDYSYKENEDGFELWTESKVMLIESNLFEKIKFKVING